MTDLKRTASEINDDDVCCVGSDEKYPWGMRLHLQTAEIDKLGLGLPKVGSEVVFTGKAIVQEVSSREELDGKKNSSVQLQLTEMDIPNVSNDDEKAERLYGDD